MLVKYYCYYYYIKNACYSWIGSSWNSWIPKCWKIIFDQPFVKAKNVSSSSKARNHKRFEVSYSFYFPPWIIFKQESETNQNIVAAFLFVNKLFVVCLTCYLLAIDSKYANNVVKNAPQTKMTKKNERTSKSNGCNSVKNNILPTYATTNLLSEPS